MTIITVAPAVDKKLEAVAGRHGLKIGFNPTYGYFMLQDVNSGWPIKAYGRYTVGDLTPEQLESDIVEALNKEIEPLEIPQNTRPRKPSGRFAREDR